MNFRQMREYIAAVTKEMFQLKGQDLDIIVGHNTIDNRYARLHYKVEPKNPEQRFVLLTSAVKGKSWQIGFCKGLNLTQENFFFCYVEGDDLVATTAKIVFNYLEDGSYPSDPIADPIE